MKVENLERAKILSAKLSKIGECLLNHKKNTEEIRLLVFESMSCLSLDAKKEIEKLVIEKLKIEEKVILTEIEEL